MGGPDGLTREKFERMRDGIIAKVISDEDSDTGDAIITSASERYRAGNGWAAGDNRGDILFFFLWAIVTWLTQG